MACVLDGEIHVRACIGEELCERFRAFGRDQVIGLACGNQDRRAVELRLGFRHAHRPGSQETRAGY